jgi:hypothetical protein
VEILLFNPSSCILILDNDNNLVPGALSFITVNTCCSQSDEVPKQPQNNVGKPQFSKAFTILVALYCVMKLLRIRSDSSQNRHRSGARAKSRTPSLVHRAGCHVVRTSSVFFFFFANDRHSIVAIPRHRSMTVVLSWNSNLLLRITRTHG